ncbi:polysaccharide deacetylase family protein [Thiocystis violacea]|uniref:polysaccharide deacetylase family protein n=1 Tax=Thiocystis violacea TaxID=13725 RepID=UPI0019058A93|nr:polysaccharide deacetylase family protein [Thiocystis violacea]MBK1724690.1 carbohydrate esterase family protein [Thiocystis violacea]
MNILFRPFFSLLSPAGNRARLSIFIFHRVLAQPDPIFPEEPDIERFEQLIVWLKSWLNILPLANAIDGLHSRSLPARAAAITFDDGYADNYLNAAPILRKHDLHATFFIASGFLDSGRMWNDTLIEAIRATRLDHLETSLPGIPSLSLATLADRRRAIDILIPAIKHLDPATRADLVTRIGTACDASLPDKLMLTSDQLRDLFGMGMGIGAHTLNHPILASTDPGTAYHEIVEGRRRLEDILSEPMTLFAYPNGRAGTDYGPEHVDMVRDLGFHAAVSTHWGVNDANSDRFQLARFTPWDRSQLRFGLRLLDNYRSRSVLTR